MKPNRNHSSSQFWYEVVYKLIYDGECLIVPTREGELLVADDFYRDELAVREDKFKKVFADNLELEGSFERSEVIYLEYGTDKLRSIIHGLFDDYGKIMGNMVKAQMKKGQTRATVDIDATFMKNKEGIERLQNHIDRMYDAFDEKTFGVAPQEKGFNYTEHSTQNTNGASVDEIEKLTDGFLDHLCHAVGLPPNLIKGDMADVESATRNAMRFCIDPIIKMINDELNMQLIRKRDYINKGSRIEVKRVRTRDLFDTSEAVDKLISSGVFNANELRDELGWDITDEETHNKYYVTKNYQESEQSLEGGDSDFGEEET